MAGQFNLTIAAQDKAGRAIKGIRSDLNNLRNDVRDLTMRINTGGNGLSEIERLKRLTDDLQNENIRISTDLGNSLRDISSLRGELSRLNDETITVNAEVSDSSLNRIRSQLEGLNFSPIASGIASVGLMASGIAQTEAENKFRLYGNDESEIKNLVNVSKDVVIGGAYGGLSEVSDSLALVKQSFGDLNNDELNFTTKALMNISKLYEEDIASAIKSVSRMQIASGLSLEENLDLALNAKQYSPGIELDNLSEYSMFGSELGYTKDNFKEYWANVLAGYEKGGAYTVDKMADWSKEAYLQFSNPSTELKDLMTEMDVSWSDTVSGLTSSSDKGKVAFEAVIDAWNSQTKEYRAANMTTFFAAVGEDVGTKAIEQWGKADDVLGNFSDTNKKLINDLEDNPLAKLSGSFQAFVLAFAPIGSVLLDIGASIATFVKPAFELLGSVINGMGPVFQGIVGVLSVVGGAFLGVVGVVRGLLGALGVGGAGAAGASSGGLLSALSGVWTWLLRIGKVALRFVPYVGWIITIVSVLIGTFKALGISFDDVVNGFKHGISKIVGWFKGIGTSIKEGFVSGLNGVIGVINIFIKLINDTLSKINIKVPDWVPKYGGKELNLGAGLQIGELKGFGSGSGSTSNSDYSSKFASSRAIEHKSTIQVMIDKKQIGVAAKTEYLKAFQN